MAEAMAEDDDEEDAVVTVVRGTEVDIAERLWELNNEKRRS